MEEEEGGREGEGREERREELDPRAYFQVRSSCALRPQTGRSLSALGQSVFQGGLMVHKWQRDGLCGRGDKKVASGVS